MLFGTLILAGFPLLARTQIGLSVNSVGYYTTVGDLPASTARGLSLREGEGESYSRRWRSLFGEEDRGQTVRLMPDTLRPNVLVLRQVEREDIEEHLAMGSNGPTLAHFIINPERNPSRLGRAYPPLPRLEGRLFSGKILDLAPMGVALSSVYLEEQAFFDPGITPNQAWSLGADTQLFSGQVHFSGEYAWSRDRRKLPGAMPAQDDDAYKLQLSYRPSSATLWAFPLDWTMGIKHQRVGPFFRSPAVPNGRRDVSLVEAFTHLGWRGLTLDTMLAQEKINFASPHRGSPPQDQRVFQLIGGYRFLNLGLPSWLGIPRLNVLFSRRNSAAFEQGTSSAKLEAAFSHRNWSWSLNQTLSWHGGQANRHFSGRSKVTAMETRFRLLDNRLSLAPVLQYRHYAVEPSTNEQWLAGVNTCAVFIPERLKGQFRTDVKRTWNGVGMQHIYSTGGDLNWQLSRPKAHGLAARLFLEGRYEAILNQRNDTTAFMEDYLVLLGVAFD
jgi:hypothetical protein